MPRQIFVNLPIKNMEKSQAFFRALGFAFNPQFTNDQGACLVISEGIHVMLLVESFYQTFTDKKLADARKVNEVLVCFSCDSREEVDAFVRKAKAAGGTVTRPPQDHGFMYGHGFEDPDGHIWELVHMRSAPPNAG